jgi:O-antigen ligase
VVLAMSVVLVLLALRKVGLRLGLGLLILMWAGLLFSYSQSSMAALVVVTLAIAAVTGDARVRKAVAVAAAVAVVAAVGVAAAKLVSGDSLRQISSDRTERVQDTTRVIAKHPLVGVGIGGQPAESRRLAHSTRPRENFVSHTTPLTVAAELGVIGLVLYAWLLLGGARVLLEVSRFDQVLGLALGAAFVALFVHALSYSGFLEDPLTWVVLAVGSGYLAQAARTSPESKQEPAAVPS